MNLKKLRWMLVLLLAVNVLALIISFHNPALGQAIAGIVTGVATIGLLSATAMYVETNQRTLDSNERALALAREQFESNKPKLKIERGQTLISVTHNPAGGATIYCALLLDLTNQGGMIPTTLKLHGATFEDPLFTSVFKEGFSERADVGTAVTPLVTIEPGRTVRMYLHVQGRNQTIVPDEVRVKATISDAFTGALEPLQLSAVVSSDYHVVK